MNNFEINLPLFNSIKEKSAPLTLRPYQAEAVENVKKNYLSGRSSNQLIILPTASGKTPVLSSLCEWVVSTGKKAIVLAHREELLDQAMNEITEVAPHLRVTKEQADNIADLSADVIVASVQSIGTKVTEHRISKFNPLDFGAVLLDECHHALNQTTTNAINYFKQNPKMLSIGVTATHIRSDGESLSTVYDTIAFQRDIITMAREGWLTPILSRRVKSSTSLKGIRTTAGDFNIKELSEAVNNEDRNKLILQTYLEYNIPCVVYATDLAHANELHELFLTEGIKSAYLAGDTNKHERKKILEDFQSQKIKVIFNFGILTEGWNCKFLSLAIVARPTQSSLLLTQIIGRLFRKFESKEFSTVIEIVDMHSEKTATTAQIFSFTKTFDCEGHTFLECSNVADSMISEKDFFNPYDCKNWTEMLARYQRATRTNPKGDNRKEKKEKEEQEERLEGDGIRKFKYKFHKTNADTYKLIHADKDENMKYLFHIKQNGLGEWILTIVRKPLGADYSADGEIIKQYKRDSLQDARYCADDFIWQYYRSWDSLININAPWRKKAELQPCSDAQYNILIKNGLCKEPREEINKALASDIIGAFFATR